MIKQTTRQKGFSLIELLIVVAIIGIIAAVAIPNLLASRKAANESSAIAGIRTMFNAESTYHTTVGQGNYATSAELASNGLIDSVLGDNTKLKAGFRFDAAPEAGFPQQFYAVAVADSVSTASRNFYTNELGVIHATPQGTLPTRASPGAPIK